MQNGQATFTVSLTVFSPPRFNCFPALGLNAGKHLQGCWLNRCARAKNGDRSIGFEGEVLPFLSGPGRISHKVVSPGGFDAECA